MVKNKNINVKVRVHKEYTLNYPFDELKKHSEIHSGFEQDTDSLRSIAKLHAVRDVETCCLPPTSMLVTAHLETEDTPDNTGTLKTLEDDLLATA
jgi:hypothetical protein